MVSLLFALSPAAVKHEMTALPGRSRPLPASEAGAGTLVSQEQRERKPFPRRAAWHFHLIPAHLTVKTSQSGRFKATNLFLQPAIFSV
jgi:hypothetical protein